MNEMPRQRSLVIFRYTQYIKMTLLYVRFVINVAWYCGTSVTNVNILRSVGINSNYATVMFTQTFKQLEEV